MKFKIAPNFLYINGEINKVLEENKINGFIKDQNKKMKRILIWVCTHLKLMFNYLTIAKDTLEVEEFQIIDM